MISIDFDGFFGNPKVLPAKSGIYAVFACRVRSNTIYDARIIYIGKAENLLTRHYNDGNYRHERLLDFKRECQDGEAIYYCYATIDSQDLDKVENALVAMQQPPLNNNLIKSYNYKADSFQINGAGSIHFKFQKFKFL